MIQQRLPQCLGPSQFAIIAPLLSQSATSRLQHGPDVDEKKQVCGQHERCEPAAS